MQTMLDGLRQRGISLAGISLTREKQNRSNKVREVVSNLGSTSVALVSCVLAILLVVPMILLRNRNNIIVQYKNLVQRLTITFTTCLGTICTTALKSYLTQPTALKSYPKKWITNAIVKRLDLCPPVVIPLVALATSTPDANASLGEFTDVSSNEKNTEDISENPLDKLEEITKAAYGYVRQSQSSPDDSSDETHSISVQKQHVNSIGEEVGYKIAKIFEDMNESGFSFERDGFTNLQECLEQNPKPVVLDRINRLGRNTLETIYVAGTIHYEYEVKIITYRNGVYDLDSTSDQITLVIEAITAGKSVEDRVRAAWDTIKRKFLKEDVWNTWFDNTRLGYRLPENKDWPETVPEGTEVVSAIMKDVIEAENYAKVAELISNCANNKSINDITDQNYALPEVPADDITAVFEFSDLDIDDIDGPIVKRIVTDPIYVGKIVYPRYEESSEQAEKEDPDLRLVDEELFNEVNKVVDEIAEKYSTTTDSVDMEELSDMGLMLTALEEVDVIKPVCNHCGRGMVKNRSETLQDGTKCHYWACPKYYNDGEVNADHTQRKVPRDGEWELLKDQAEAERSDVVALRIKPFDH